jgi:hypothetical protein
VVEHWGDIKIILQNQLTKIKTKLLTNLAKEISKPIRPRKQLFAHALEATERTFGMIEMAFGLSFQLDDSMIANNFVLAQLEAEEDSAQSFANEQQRLAMTRVPHDYKTAYDSETNNNIDFERLFNQFGSVFKLEVQSPEDQADEVSQTLCSTKKTIKKMRTNQRRL